MKLKLANTIGIGIFLSITLRMSAQIVLSATDNPDKNVTAPHSINLMPGYKVSAGENTYYRAFIDSDGDGFSDEVLPPGTPLENGPLRHFADSKGELTVSAMGSSNYTIPIALPPGIKNVAPQVSLVYNSSSDNGMAGYGWNITGISAISLTSTRLDLDGYIDGVNFNADDKFSLDGQRLVVKEGEYGKEGAVYQTEIYSNLRIESVGYISIPGIGGKRPKYFKVIFPDGTRVYYGTSFESRGITEWLITKWVDPQGNCIEYFYDKDQNTTYITKIVWGGNEKLNTGYSNVIQFYYKKRGRSEFAYVHGVRLLNSRILDKIEVEAGGRLFKKYQVTHQTITGNYQRVAAVQEFNGNGEPANPIIFSYDTTANSFGGYQKDKSDALWDLKKVKMTGDFNGNGQVDVLAGGKMYKDLFQNLGRGDGNIIQADTDKLVNYPITTLTDGKLNNFQSIVNYQEKSPLGISNTQQEYAMQNKLLLEVSNFNKANNAFIKKYTKQLDYPYTNQHINKCFRKSTETTFYSGLEYKFLEGDFNGDGISELIIFGKSEMKESKYKWNLITSPGKPSTWVKKCEPTVSYNTDIAPYYVDMNPTITNEESYRKLDTAYFRFDTDNYVIDFDGDGKSDIISFYGTSKKGEPGGYKIVTLDKEKRFRVIRQGIIPEYDGKKVILIGDFNGDGKSDFMIPEKEGSSKWYMYISTGKRFDKNVYNNLAEYLPFWGGKSDKKRRRYKTYTAADLNKDGKTDFIISIYESYKPSMFDNARKGKAFIQYFENLGGEEKPLFGAMLESGIRSEYGYKDPITLLLADYKNNEKTGNLVFVQGNEIWKGSFTKDLRKDILLTGVSESDGNIVSHIEYASLEPNDKNSGLGDIEGTYHSSEEERYPYKEISHAPNVDVVKKLVVTTAGAPKLEKEYKYFGLVSHAGGLGLLGFKIVAESGWKSAGISTVNWNVTHNSPSLRGAPISGWTIRGDHKNQITNPQDNYLISRKDITYHSGLLNDKRWVQVISKQEEKDYLTGIKTTTDYEHDSYYNTRKTITSNGIGQKITEYTYADNPSGKETNYYIGRLRQTRSRVSAYGDVYTAEEEYSYTENLITQVRKKGHNTDYITENMQYDTFGNLIQKTISAPGVSPRTIKDRYDPTGRFVIQKTDADNLTEYFSYNHLGQVLSHSGPLNEVTKTLYDAWGKLRKVTTEGLSAEPIVSYTRYQRTSGGGVKITTYSDQTGEYSEVCKNVLWNDIKTTTKGFTPGTYISKQINYDALGRKIGESEPYFEGENPYGWNTIEYDDLNRPVKQMLFSGKTIITTYNGLSVTTDDGTKKKTLTQDANGNIRTLTDNGEVINYTYYANGNQKTADYGGHVITSRYDGWGRRISLLDPSVSAIPYTHRYNNYGEVLAETTPNGTTAYTYSPTGKVLTKTVAGDYTDVSVTYEYSDKGLLIKETGTSNNEYYGYEYTYDPLYRLIASQEITPKVTYRKEYTYDPWGRNHTEKKTTRYGNLISSVSVQYDYNPYNGMMEKVSETETGKVIWQLTGMNERMQTLSAKLGNDITIRNTIDKAGFITGIRHSGRLAEPLALDYDFNWKRGTLNSRYNYSYDWWEQFTYDTFDRLVSWADPNGTNTNQYASDGRITSNSQVGEYRYQSPARYKKSAIDLNSLGKDYYLTKPRQQITYNAFKNPVEIIETEEGKNGQRVFTENEKKVTFSYNIHNTRNSAVVRVKPNEALYKYYSDAKDVEIISEAGITKMITYISGSPYDAPAAFITQFKELGAGRPKKTEEGFYYFHRDYQGTILAISNKTGETIERRLYDPWGEVVKVTDGQGNIQTDHPKFRFIDRGYTGHEHFFTVGLIHMNGRMYDPVLKQFLSPDNNIQEPYNTQNYNRYGYVLNNPLMYTDPSGEIFGLTAVASAAVIGSIIGGATYTAYALCTDSFTWLGFAKSVLMGGAGGAAAYGVGTLSNVVRTSICATTQTMTAVQVDMIVAGMEGAMNGLTQGLIQGISGGDILQGFSSGGVSSLVSSAIGMSGAAAGIDGTKIGGTLFFGVISGGFGAVLTNGNFWQGAATGLIVSGLNHVAHKLRVNSINKTFEQLQNDKNVESLVIELLKEKKGTILTGKEIKNKYNLKQDIQRAIKKIEILGDGKFNVSWNNKLLINAATVLNVKDGVLNVKHMNINRMSGFHLKGSISAKIDGEIFYNLFLDLNYIYGIKNNNKLTAGYGF